MLHINNVVKTFGGLVALDNITMNVEEGEIRGLIGPNGSGKTTLFNLISGLYRPDSGIITLKDERIDHLSTNAIAMKGVGRTFQIPKPFRDLSVIENLLVPGYARKAYNNSEEMVARALQLVEIVGLTHIRDERSRNLSGGQLKLLELIRVLMMDPTLILVDEPFAGVHAVIKESIMNFIKTINRNYKKTFVIISHDVPSTMNLCEKITVLVSGKIISEGSPLEIKNDAGVVEAYLGK